MIFRLSPPIRRIIAVGLLVLVGLIGITAAQGLISAMWGALGGLEQARGRVARLESLRVRPPPPETAPIPQGLAFRARDHETAAAMAIARVEAAAAAAELTPELLLAAPQDGASPQLISVAVTAEGPETRMLGFVSAIERDLPAIRLRAWRISRSVGDAQALRLEATAAAAWEEEP